MSDLRIAVDTGGTFTDFVVLDESSGQVSIAKILSSPHDPSVSIIEGVERFLGADEHRITYFCHGTTVGTNALLEEKGVRTGLLVTAGFRGIYEIMEQARPHGPALFDLEYDKPRMLAAQRSTGEVTERLDHTGRVLLPLDEQTLRATLRDLSGEDVESIAVCLLFAYLAPQHERRVREIVEEVLPGCFVSLSSDILPQIREYPRLSTTVVNAYLQPIVQRYLTNLQASLHARGVTTSQAYVMQSNGGTATFEKAAEKAAATLLSGPAGGATAGARLSRLCGLDKAITFDMGGTSCDVALVVDGQAHLGSGGTIAGRHVTLPSLDIDTVSAGGGTLASVDEHGVLAVGPDSAGSIPGPACYGRGGQRPTVTDANLLLGYLSDRSRLGGSLALDESAARHAVQEHVAGPLDLDVYAAARGVIDVVNIQMQEAIKGISTARGHDLRDFTLIGFGGAGPVHAAALADELHMAGVLIPANPGVLSALGLLIADVQHDYLQSRLDRLLDLTEEQVTASLDELIQHARTDLHSEGFTDEQIEYDLALDMRYAGQGYDVRVPITTTMLSKGFDIVRKAFDDQHLESFGHSAPDETVEVVSYRVTGRGRVPEVPLAATHARGHTLAEARTTTRRVRFGDRAVDCPVYSRERLDPGLEFVGPAVIDQEDSTVVIWPDQPVRVDQWLNLHLGRRPTEGLT